MKFQERFKEIILAYEKNYWNNYWNKTNVMYSPRPDWHSGHSVKYIFTLDSSQSEKELEDYFLPLAKKLNLDTDDKRAIWAFKWVLSSKIYSGDFKRMKLPEHWYTPYEAFKSLEGDCEDMAILLYKICRILGIPAYKLKLRASLVKYNGKVGAHCYLNYLTRGNNQWSKEWYVLDWCYLPSLSLKNFKNIPVRKIVMYNPPEQLSYKNQFKWSFNEEFEWKQTTWLLPYKRKVGDIKI